MDLTREEIKGAHRFVTEDLNRNANLETFSERLPPTYDRLVEVAVENEVVHYGDLANHVGTNKRNYLSKLLDGIGYIQKQREKPPLTVLVVYAGNERPADRFLELLDTLGLRNRYSSITSDGLVDEVMDETHQYYG